MNISINIFKLFSSQKFKKEISTLISSFLVLISLYITFISVLNRPFLFPFTENNIKINNNTNNNIIINKTIINNINKNNNKEKKEIIIINNYFINNFISIFFLWASSLIAGHIAYYAKLPPLLGMLLIGIIFANFPLLYIQNSWATFLRKTAFLLILLRCGFGLNFKVLQKEILFCSSLGLLSTFIEIISIFIISYFYFNIDLSIAILFGFVLASTSPAVTVPTMIELQHKHKGTSKGIPTIVLASALIDNIFCITSFSIAYEIVSSTKEEIINKLISVPIQILVGILFGCFFGLLIQNIPFVNFSSKLHFSRTILLCFSSTALYFGFEYLNYSISGPISVLIASFLAAFSWANDNPKKVRPEAKALCLIWDLIFLPLLFSLIGLLFNFSIFTFTIFINSILFIFIIIIIRILIVFLITNFNQKLNLKEKFFFSSVFIPKATVQAALAPILFEFSNLITKNNSQFILQTCILSILFTAPFGQFLIKILGQYLLTNDFNKNNKRTSTITPIIETK
ncbi:Na_H_Exchanger domain-containing protein [Meloidogyne graminicola]|uniref:Na_H_Exchanger domain-containing protein n=1 Tax=Meloidogyne graminicola TaxID=189291 RepID=A0A8S9ZS05_9BILA|nr:Na_H_Exchanger domain-containing protein [Meloidogyne graminicola]